MATGGIRTVDYRQRTVTPHQVAAVLAGGELESGVTILHDCDLRLCCCTDAGHVRVATQSENMQQARLARPSSRATTGTG